MYTSRIMIAAGAMAAVLALPSAAIAGETKLVANLAGANETAGGDPDGTGHFVANVDADAGDLCYTLSVKGIATPVAAHIHSGAAGSDGDVVTKLEVTGEDLDECVALEPDKLKEIVASPADFYVNVHTGDFPKGAVRGQLGAQ